MGLLRAILSPWGGTCLPENEATEESTTRHGKDIEIFEHLDPVVSH